MNPLNRPQTADSPTELPSTNDTRHAWTRRRARVLVAEDDDQLRDLVAAQLRREGNEVTTVANGSEMLKTLAQASITRFPHDAFDLIVTDVRMPGVTGLSAIARLRDVGYATPVITMTAFPDDDVRQRARELDMLVLDKPFKLSDLHDATHYFLGDLAAR